MNNICIHSDITFFLFFIVGRLHFINATSPSSIFVFDNSGRFGSSTKVARFVGPIGQGLAAYRFKVVVVGVPKRTTAEVAITSLG